MTISVLRAGAMSTVQDAGRTGSRHLGVGSAGAADRVSAGIANLLVGNARDAAVLEFTLAGPSLRTERSICIAITGASIEAWCDGHVLPGWRPIDVPAGSELRFGACRAGARAYLAVGGGLELPRVLGSASTDLRGGFGGFEGRALKAGDALRLRRAGNGDALRIAPWWIDAQADLDLARDALAHLLPGHDDTDPAGAICAQAWRVGSDSDRQGLRLDGPALSLAETRERISEPVAPGTVQLPPDGRPIVLLADAQTVGGYPRIGHVASADLPRLAQCRPGDALHFTPIDTSGAHALLRGQQQRLARIELAIAQRAASRR